jgi:hypothetical protein
MLLILDKNSFSLVLHDFICEIYVRYWLTVIFLPKRSPNLNPVETRVNRNLKKGVCANHNYGTEENLVKAVRRYLRCMGSWPKL